MENEEGTSSTKDEIVNFEFPIKYRGGFALMKNIPPLEIMNFVGLESEDLDTFVFELNVLCKSYECYQCLEIEIIPCQIEECNTSLVHGNQWGYYLDVE